MNHGVTLALLVVLCSTAAVSAEEEDPDYAQVVHVRAERSAAGRWRFDVTVRHGDSGWDHYADAWQVVEPESGKVIAERVLAHPHVDEQPFTRSKGGVSIDPRTRKVLVRARCNAHGFGGRTILVELSPGRRHDYEVIR